MCEQRMPGQPPPEQLDVLEFVEQFERDRRGGAIRPLRSYLELFPRCEAEIAAEYLRLRQGDLVVGADDAAAAPARGTAGRLVGHYRLLRELGRGGQGTVFLAADARIGRTVALKLLARADLADSAARLRFRREAEAIARLEHPALCSVLEAEFDGDEPFLAMRFVDGETLKQRLARLCGSGGGAARPDRRQIPAIALLIERVARGLHAAHEAGVIHRDIKPGNIQIDTDGRPVVLDFGLARIERDDRATVTMPGHVFGTLAYMAPEQLLGQRERRGESRGRDAGVDRRVDVYALGLVLFECLTLEHAFDGVDTSMLADPLRRPPVPDVRTRNAAVPVDLAVVLATALAIDPAERYPTALAFAEDLRRVREFEPIAARPAPPWRRARRWLRRRRRPLAIVVGAVLAFALVAWNRIDQMAAARVARASQVVSLTRTLVVTDPARALVLCEKAESMMPQDDVMRTTIYAALENQREVWATSGDDGKVLAHAVCGDTVVCGFDRGEVQVRVVTSGDVLRARRFPVPVTSIAPVDDAGGFVVVTADGLLHRGRGSDELVTMTGPDLRGGCLLEVCRVPGTGDLLLVTTDNAVFRWRALTTLQPLGEAVEGWPRSIDDVLVIAEDSRTAAVAMCRESGSGDARHAESRLCVFDLESGVRRWDSGVVADLRYHVALSPDGRQLAWGGHTQRDGRLLLRDLDEHRAVIDARLPGCEVVAVEFDGDGHLLVGTMNMDSLDVAASSDAIRVYDCDDGGLRRTLPGHGMRSVLSLRLDPAGRRLAVGCLDNTVCIRRPFEAAAELVLRPIEGNPSRLTWAGERLLVLADHLRSVSCWSLGQGAIPALRGHDGSVVAVGFLAGDRQVFTAGDDGLVRVWDARNARLQRTIDCGVGPLRFARAAAAGTVVCAISKQDGRAALCHADTGAVELVAISQDAGLTALAVRGPGDLVAVGSAAGDVAVVLLGPETTVRHLGHHGAAVNCFAFSGNGGALLSGADERNTVEWDLATGAARAFEPFLPTALPERHHVFAAAPHPDGGWLVATDDPRIVAVDGDLRVRHWCDTSTVGCMAMHPHRTLLAISTRYYGASCLYDASGTVVTSLPPNGNRMSRILFGSSGKFVLSCSLDGTARLGRVDTGGFELWGLLGDGATAILDADLSSDETTVVTAGVDGVARIWPTDPMAFARSLRFRRPAVDLATELQRLGR